MALLVRLGKVSAIESARASLNRAMRTKEFKVVLGLVELIEADIGLDGDARTGVSKVRIVR